MFLISSKIASFQRTLRMAGFSTENRSGDHGEKDISHTGYVMSSFLREKEVL